MDHHQEHMDTQQRLLSVDLVVMGPLPEMVEVYLDYLMAQFHIQIQF
jgi:hypothetical protein